MPYEHLDENIVKSLYHQRPPKGERAITIWDLDTPALGIRVSSTGRTTYFGMWHDINRRQTEETFGTTAEMSLEEARDKARHRYNMSVVSTKRNLDPRPCEYVAEGIHHFNPSDKKQRFCDSTCRRKNYYTKTTRRIVRPVKSYAPYTPPETLSDNNLEDNNQDIALLQHQLDELEQRIDQLVEEKVNEKLQQITEILASNLLTLLTSKL